MAAARCASGRCTCWCWWSVYLNAPWFIGPTIWKPSRPLHGWPTSSSCRISFISRCPRPSAPPGRWRSRSSITSSGRPLVRFLRRPWMLATVLACALIASPLLRHAHLRWITPTHTLIHLDGIALGSLLALGLYTIPLTRRTWLLDRPGRAAARHRRRGHHRRRHRVSRFRAGGRLCRRSAGRHRLNRRAQSAQRRAAPRTAGLLWPHQLRPLHDSHHGLHLLRLVRPAAWTATASPAIWPSSPSAWPPPPRQPPRSGTALSRKFSSSSATSEASSASHRIPMMRRRAMPSHNVNRRLSMLVTSITPALTPGC